MHYLDSSVPWAPLLIRLVATHVADAQLDWDLWSLEAASTPRALCYVPPAVPELFLECGGSATGDVCFHR